jgi:plasmid maintenance system antidote protein VapI
MSFRITLPRHKRDGARFVGSVSRELQKVLAEEQKETGLKQADIARTLGVNRATITRQIHGHENMTLLRVGELGSAMGRHAVISFPKQTSVSSGSNEKPAAVSLRYETTTSNAVATPRMLDRKNLEK